MIYIIIPTTEERRPRLEQCINSIRGCKLPITICSHENKVGWVNAVQNMIEDINGLVFILGDDALLDESCIEHLYNAYMALPEGEREEWLLQPYEQINRGELAVFPFCHSNLIKKLLYKGYHHLWADTEITDITKEQGRYLPVLNAKVHHHHFMFDSNLIDETYKLSQAGNSKDKALYDERKLNGFNPRNI